MTVADPKWATNEDGDYGEVSTNEINFGSANAANWRM